MITPDSFECDRKCGECCIYLSVKLSKKEIEKIKKAGYEDFFEWDSHIKSYVIRMTDNGCFFLGKKGDGYYCKIYQMRPRVCQLYPFVNKTELESCKPALLKYKFNK